MRVKFPSGKIKWLLQGTDFETMKPIYYEDLQDGFVAYKALYKMVDPQVAFKMSSYTPAQADKIITELHFKGITDE